MSYSSYKFHKAIRSLAIARGQKRAWLSSDYVSRIILLLPEDLPAEIQLEFRQFQRDMTIVQADSITASLRATVGAMTETEVIKMILRIIKMHDVLKAHEEPIDLQFPPSTNGEMQDRAA